MKHQAYQELKKLVLGGALPNDEVRTVRDLAGSLQFSEITVFAAVEMLEQEGLVRFATPTGIAVRDTSALDVRHRFEIRMVFEPFVVHRLAGELMPHQIAILLDLMQQYRELMPNGPCLELAEADFEFHKSLCEFFGNDEIVRVMRQLKDRALPVILRALRRCPDRIDATEIEHTAILEALVAGDRDGAQRAMTEHLQRGVKVLLGTEP